MTHTMDKRIHRSKSALKETFLQLLYLKPFDQISISEIVREADYNRGTFYANFDTKEDLLNELIQDVLKELIHQIRNPYQFAEKVNMKEMKTESITLFHYLKENSKLYRLMLSDHIKVDFRHKIASAIETHFIEAYDYELPEDTTIDLNSLYIFRAYGVAGLIIRWIEEDFPTAPEFMSEQVVQLMVVSTDVFHVKNGLNN